MRSLLSILIVCAVALSSLFSPTLAAPPVINWWNDSHVIQALDLTPDQRQKIGGIVKESLKKREAFSQQLAPLQATISAGLKHPTLNVAEIQRALTAQLELRNARRREAVSMRIQVRQVLSSEQFKKLLELHPLIMQQRWMRPQIHVEVQRQSSVKEKTAADPHDEDDETEEKDDDAL